MPVLWVVTRSDTAEAPLVRKKLSEFNTLRPARSVTTSWACAHREGTTAKRNTPDPRRSGCELMEMDYRLASRALWVGDVSAWRRRLAVSLTTMSKNLLPSRGWSANKALRLCDERTAKSLGSVVTQLAMRVSPSNKEISPMTSPGESSCTTVSTPLRFLTIAALPVIRKAKKSPASPARITVDWRGTP